MIRIIIILTLLLFILDINAIPENDNTDANDDTYKMLSNQLKETLKSKVSINFSIEGIL